MSLFPMIQPALAASKQTLPLAREVSWNFERDEPVLRRGEPQFVTGANAVAVWAWNALSTVRYRHEIYSWDYGCEVETLTGQSYSSETKKAEAARYVREALLQSPYITGVEDIRVSFEKSTLRISCKVQTVYGPLQIERGQKNG